MMVEKLHSLRQMLDDVIVLEESGEYPLHTEVTEEGMATIGAHANADLSLILLIGTLEIVVHQLMSLLEEYKDMAGEL